jgi:hypothetical protein
MARFAGKVGYGISTDKGHGVSDLVITERTYMGDVMVNSRRIIEGEKVVSDIQTSNSLSLVVDEFATLYFHAIRYVDWMGVLWVVRSATVQRPRLILTLGGVYNGPKAEPAPSTP